MTDSILDLDAVLDQDMGAVADVPDFVEPPAGLYDLGITKAAAEEYKNAEGNMIGRLRVTYKVNATIEVEGDELPVPDGSLFSETFQLTEQGLEFFKKSAKNILGVTDMAGVSVRELLTELSGIESFQAKITVRMSESKGKTYRNTNVRPITA
jgi:hypothetical protein